MQEEVIAPLSSRRKVLVIGLDGAVYSIVDPLLAEGKLPALARLQKEGARGVLTSTMPPNSAPAWTSFMTGVTPARHGILDFKEADLRRYDGFTGNFVTSAAFAGHTIFDLIGAESAGVLAFRVPMTFPVWPVNGVMVAGYPTPDRTKAYVFPPEMASSLEPLALHSHDEIARAGIPEERKNADYEIEKLVSTMGRFLREGKLDFYMGVTGVSDGFHHKFWKYHDPAHPLHNPAWPAADRNIIREYYSKLDAAVGELLALVDESWLVFVMSDHGGGPKPHRLFNTNAWLREQGWLTLRGGEESSWQRNQRRGLEWLRARLPFKTWLAQHLPGSVQEQVRSVRSATNLIDWSATKAYRIGLQFPAEGIMINLQGRQPQGIVAPGRDYEQLRDEIIAGVQNLRDPLSGEPVVVAAQRREALYPSGDLDKVPDILLQMNPHLGGGTDVSDLFSDVPLSYLERLNGDHTMHGITLVWGSGVQPGTCFDLNIIDLAPTILYAMGLPVPDGMDGRVLTEIFTPEYLAAHHVVYRDGGALGDEDGDHYEMSAAEEAEIRKALAGLGYVDE